MKKGSVQMQQQQQNKTNKEKKSSIPKTEQEKDEVDKTKKKLYLKKKLNIEDDPTIDQQVKNPMQESSLTKMRKTSYFETQTIVIQVLSNLSFRKHVRLSGFIILLILLIVASLNFIVFYIYGRPNFQRINQPFVWIFLLFSILYVLLFSHIIFKWKNQVRDYVKVEYSLDSKPITATPQQTVPDVTPKDPNAGTAFRIRSTSRDKFIRKKEIGKNKNIIDKIKSNYVAASKFYDKHYGVNGKYYLYLLYIGELTEDWIQLSNLILFFSCVLPTEWNVFFGIILLIESLHRSIFFFRKIWLIDEKINFQERNFQTIAEIVIDIVFLIMPISVTYFVYGLSSITPLEVLRVVAYPSISLLLKLPAVIEETINNNVYDEIECKQDTVSRDSFRRRRKSIFGESTNEAIVKVQNKYLPRKLRFAIFVTSTSYVVLLTSILIIQLASLSSLDNCNETLSGIYKNGCEVKTPYCKRIFEPTCNCASFKMVNNYSLTKLPNNMADEMFALRGVLIKDCNLTKLPDNFDKLKQMTSFQILFNKLNEFNVDVSEWEKLHRLELSYNNIVKYNEAAIWSHKSLSFLNLNDNIGMTLPSSKNDIHMPSLTFLALNNNSINIDFSFDKAIFPNINYLLLNGNTIRSFPDKSLKDTLIKLGVARCNLLSIPAYISDFRKLIYLDARDNNITKVDDSLQSLIEENNVENYFTGNQVCNSDQSASEALDCGEVCNKYCSSRNHKDDICNYDCNSKVCDYDGGDCDG